MRISALSALTIILASALPAGCSALPLSLSKVDVDGTLYGTTVIGADATHH